MEHGVHITLIFLASDTVEHCADGICNPSRQEVEKAFNGNRLYRWLYSEYNDPADTNIARHRQLSVFVMINGSKNGCHRAESPDDTKERPSECR